MMKIYMSLWTNTTSFTTNHKNIWKLSLALAKKHYGEVSLITDDYGYSIMQDLPFDDFIIGLNTVPDYPTIYTLGKIYSYKYICSLNEPFLHLDGDALLWEPLPESLLNSQLFVQSYDYAIMQHDAYNVYKLQADLNSVVPNEWLNNIGLAAYNTGLFGGSNISLIDGYCDYVISMIENPVFHNLWSGMPGQLSASTLDNFNSAQAKSLLLEQANLAIYCQIHNTTPAMLFTEISDPNKLTYKKYTHLIKDKNNPILLQRIANRLQSYPYDLAPRDISMDEWHMID